MWINKEYWSHHRKVVSCFTVHFQLQVPNRYMNYPTPYNIIYKNFPINLTSVTIYENLLNQTLVMRIKRSLVTQPLFFVVQNNNQK